MFSLTFDADLNGLHRTLLYDGYNSRYCKNEMIIWEYVFREYLKNQKRYDRGLFSKNDQQDLARLEPPRTRRGGGGRTNLPLTFDADANGLYRNSLRPITQDIAILKLSPKNRFGKYLRNQRRSDHGSFDKNDRLDVIHQEQPKTKIRPKSP